MTAGLKDLGIRMSNLEYLRSKIVTAGLYKHLLGFFVDQWYSCSCLRDSVFDHVNHSKLTKSKDSVLSSFRNWNCVEEIQVLILSSMTKMPFLSHSDCLPLLSSFLSSELCCFRMCVVHLCAISWTLWVVYLLFVTFGGAKVTGTNMFSNCDRLGGISGVLCDLMYNEYTLFSTDVNIYVCGYIHTRAHIF